MQILRRDRSTGEQWRFAGIELAEPAKPSLLAWPPGGAVTRHARVTCWNRDDGRTYTATVSLTDDQVISFEHRPGVQPNATVSEWHEADAMLRRAPGIAAALADRGITDLDQVLFDTWTYGYALVPEQYRDRRVGWSTSGTARRPAPTPTPIPSTACTRRRPQPDGAAGRRQLGPRRRPPSVMGEYVPRHIPGYRAREDVRPLHLTQPEGTSFTLDGNLLRWQNWSLRIGFNHREGMTLHTIGYRDGDRTRLSRTVFRWPR